MSLMIFISFTYEFVKQIFLFVQFFVCFRFTLFLKKIANSRSIKKDFALFHEWKIVDDVISLKEANLELKKGNEECKNL